MGLTFLGMSKNTVIHKKTQQRMKTPPTNNMLLLSLTKKFVLQFFVIRHPLAKTVKKNFIPIDMEKSKREFF